MSSHFSMSGVEVASQATRLGLRLLGAGYGGALAGLPLVHPRGEENRVLYARAGLLEAYRNGPLGLEQSFTVARPLADGGGGPLTLSMALSGNARPSLSSDAQTVSFTGPKGTALRYTGLSTVDARGRRLPSWLSLQSGRLLVHVDTSGAHYPIAIDPFVQQGEELGGMGTPFPSEGASVALSADGTTALIGSGSNSGPKGEGSAFIFTRSGSTWTEQAQLSTGVAHEYDYGDLVWLSSDGDTAMVDGSGDTEVSGGGKSLTYVFTRSGSTWTLSTTLPCCMEALSGDGNTALVSGHAFSQVGKTWVEGEALTIKGEPGEAWKPDRYALSYDGQTALISGTTPTHQAAFVFTRSGETWTQSAKLLPTGKENLPLGGVALSGDGDTALVGSENDAVVFARTGEAWTEQGPPLVPAGESGEARYGESVALSGDGDTALVGGENDNTTELDGAAWVYERTGETWAQVGAKRTSATEIRDGLFGRDVALSEDGGMALIGSWDEGATPFANVTLKAPEVGRCTKLGTRRGSYTNTKCTGQSLTGSDEWTPGLLNGHFTTKAGGSATFETASHKTIVCKGESGTGEYATTDTAAAVVMSFTGCEGPGGDCSSPGAAAGEVVSRTLSGVLGVEKLGATDRIGLGLSPTAGPGTVMAFDCGATEVTVRGGVIAPLTANKMTTTQTLKLAASRGKQKPEGFVGGPAEVLEASFDHGAFEQIGLSVKIIQTTAEASEVNSVY
jgi:hypothetical protein